MKMEFSDNSNAIYNDIYGNYITHWGITLILINDNSIILIMKCSLMFDQKKLISMYLKKFYYDSS